MSTFPLVLIDGDNHYLAITGILTIAMQLFFFFVAYVFQFDKVTDLAGSANFILIALLTFCSSGTYYPRQIAVTVLVVTSKLYLAAYLFIRVLKRGHDARFDEIRGYFFRFLGFWIFQMIWAWGVSLSVIFIKSDIRNPDFSSYDIGGIIVFGMGLLFEIIGDLQKDAFRGDPANRKKFLASGLWSISRHPNFFGEIAMWWGIFIIGCPLFFVTKDIPGSQWGYATVLAPLLNMCILLLLSGMPTAEGDNQQRYLFSAESKASYLQYREKTSPIIPFPTFLYARLPLLVKRIFFFEWKMYETDWNKNIDTAGTELVAQQASAVADANAI